MTLLVLNKCEYSKNFIENGLPKYIIKAFSERIYKKNNFALVQEILEKFDITPEDLIEAIQNSISYSENEDNYIIRLNDSVVCKKYKLSMLIRFIDYGSRSTKGQHLFINLMKQLSNQMPQIYKLFRTARSLKVWV